MSKLLVVVDYQVDFVNGILGCGQPAIDLEQKIIDRIKKYKQKGDTILFTKDTHMSDEYTASSEGASFPLHCELGTNGHEIYGRVCEFAENIITKNSFGSSDIVNHPLVLKSDEIELCGIATNICVFHNAIILYNFFQDKKIIVNSELCASFDNTAHTSSLEMLKSFGIKVL